MGITTKTHLPTFQGPTEAVVPTPTFSGLLTTDPADSINPYTSVGPGPAGAGLTKEEDDAIKAGAIDWLGWTSVVQRTTAVGTNWKVTLDNADLSWMAWSTATQHVTAVGTNWQVTLDDPSLTWIGWNGE